MRTRQLNCCSITDIQVMSTTGEFAEDPAKPWPALPLTMGPGQILDLGLLFTPDPANGPGQRTATIEVTLVKRQCSDS